MPLKSASHKPSSMRGISNATRRSPMPNGCMIPVTLACCQYVVAWHRDNRLATLPDYRLLGSITVIHRISSLFGCYVSFTESFTSYLVPKHPTAVVRLLRDGSYAFSCLAAGSPES